MLIALVADRRRFGASLVDQVGDDSVDLFRGLTNEDMGGDVIQDAGRQFAGGMHAGEIRPVIDPNAVLGQTTPKFVIHKMLHHIAQNNSMHGQEEPEDAESQAKAWPEGDVIRGDTGAIT